MGYYEALRRSLSQIFGRDVQDDDPALFKLYSKGRMPTTGDVPFKHAAFTPTTCPPGYQYYTDASGNMAVKCLHNTSGATTVTEASAATISANTQYTAYSAGIAVPSIGGWSAAYATGTGNVAKLERRIGRATGTCAAGAFANLSLVPALAGYYGVVKIVGVISNGAAAGATLTFESPAGTAALPSVFANTYAANIINRDLVDVVITHATLVDNQAIVVDGAGFGALDVVTIIYEYWYET